MRPEGSIYRRVAGVINECYDTEPFMFSVSESYRAFVHFRLDYKIILVEVVVFNDIFINISVLLVEESGQPELYCLKTVNCNQEQSTFPLILSVNYQQSIY